MSEDPDDPRSRSGPTTLWLLALPTGLYGMAYVFARATHRLVRYTDDWITRPNALGGPGVGFSVWEIVFWPLTTLEEFVRQLF